MPSVVLKTEVPGPRSRELMRQAEEHTPKGLAHVTPIAVARAEGALLTDVDGNTFIDFAGGIGAQNAGHRAHGVVAAVKEQADAYMHLCFMVTLYEPYVQLARKLNEITPGDFAKKTILFNSGSEAIENAVKIARAYTGRPAVITFERGFHGRTMLALSLTGQVRPYKDGFGPFMPEVYRLPVPYAYRCADCLEAPCERHSPEYLHELFRAHVAPKSVAAVVVEPVLGEGGFVVPPPDYFRGLKRICDEHGILFIADEVQTGFARTGRMFAIEHSGVEPDMMALAKSLSGGTPLSALTGRAEVMDAPPAGSLGGTYGGNPLACRAALAAIEAIEEQGLAARAEALGARVLARFRTMQERHALIGDVRGLGAMLAMELVKDRATKEPAGEETARIIRACYESGLIVLKAGADANVLRTLMPLVITDDQLDEGLAILESAVAAVDGSR
ncbi:MAG TPA: 4-aminobutyrate--2-oxoglutarate transaminase [Dehalococcoidia bacterium]|nr:4-aminobutyrate--2-oxoglutarate transaminase [Dehalococcoidia bacterium]